MTDLKTIAQREIARGRKVFIARGKFPAIPKSEGGNGCLDATTDISKVEAWVKSYPDSTGLGMLPAENEVFLDIDKENLDVLDNMQREHGILETTARPTPGGGYQYVYRIPDGVTLTNINRSKNDSRNIELKVKNQYVMAGGSIHPNGGVYQDFSDTEPEVIPEWLVGICLNKNGHKPASIPSTQGGTIPDGQRNASLASIAGAMRNKGAEQAAIEAALFEINNRQCKPPLPDGEVRAIAGSISRYEPQPKEFDYALTDSGNAEYFAHTYAEKLRYDHRRSRWLDRQTHYWREDTDGQVNRLGLKALRDKQKQTLSLADGDEKKRILKWLIDSESRARLESTLAIAKNLLPIADSGDKWDADPWLFCVANGVIDLRLGQLRDGHPADMITMHSPVIYDPQAKADRFIQFLDEVFDSDQAVIDWLQVYLGYCLTGLTREQLALIAHGLGANGKSLLLAILRYVFGDYAYNAPFSTFELFNRAAIPNDMASLVGKRLVTSSETVEGTRLNEARLKSLAGQDPITARFLHCEFFTFQPACKLFLAVNHRPRVQDDSYGFWRKVRLLPFNRQFKGKAEDKNLLDKLTAEASGVLNWLIKGCLRWQIEGLAQTPDCISQATRIYEAESDPLSQFLLDECAISPQAQVKASFFYKAYKDWCYTQGYQDREVMTATAFGRKVSQKYQKLTKRDGIFYQGVGLKCEGFVNSFTPTITGNELLPDYESRVGDNIENYSQPPTTLHTTELPNCEKCGLCEWTMTPDDKYLVCPCGNRKNEGVTK